MLPDDALRVVLLGKLKQWGSITLGDVYESLRDELKLQFHRRMVEALEREGMIEMREVGDEPVLTITPKGEEWLRAQAQPGSHQTTTERGEGYG